MFTLLHQRSTANATCSPRKADKKRLLDVTKPSVDSRWQWPCWGISSLTTSARPGSGQGVRCFGRRELVGHDVDRVRREEILVPIAESRRPARSCRPA